MLVLAKIIEKLKKKDLNCNLVVVEIRDCSKCLKVCFLFCFVLFLQNRNEFHCPTKELCVSRQILSYSSDLIFTHLYNEVAGLEHACGRPVQKLLFKILELDFLLP